MFKKRKNKRKLPCRRLRGLFQVGTRKRRGLKAAWKARVGAQIIPQERQDLHRKAYCIGRLFSYIVCHSSESALPEDALKEWHSMRTLWIQRRIRCAYNCRHLLHSYPLRSSFCSSRLRQMSRDRELRMRSRSHLYCRASRS